MRVAAALVKPIAPMKLSIKKAGAAAGSKLNKPIFGDDDEEAKRPKLAKMTYTDEERKVLEEAKFAAVGFETTTKDGKAVRLTGAAAAAAAREEENKKKMEYTKKIAALIPIEKEKLFAYNVDWALFDTEKEKIVGSHLKPWVSKKVAEFLGEEEKTLIDFIIDKVEQHSPPSAIAEELQDVLEKDAEMFTIKMWRVLLFELIQAGVKAGSIQFDVPTPSEPSAAQ